METFVGFLRASQAREHSHRPEPAPVHGGLNPSDEGIDPRETNILGIVNVFYIFRGVETFNVEIGDGGETGKAFRGFRENLGQILWPLFLFLYSLFELILLGHAISPPPGGAKS